MTHTISEAHRKAISDANKGRKKSDEQRQKMAEAQRLAWTPERRAEAKERHGPLAPTYGKKMSPENIEKQRQRMLLNNPRRGYKATDEERAAFSARYKGKAPSLKKYGVSQDEYARQLSEGNRWCFFRKHFAPVSDFGSTGCCNACRPIFQRQADLKKKYKLTPEDYRRMLSEQGEGCAICGFKPNAGDRNMMVDHNHTSGTVRGILCGPCNTAIERLETVPNWGILAAQYLSRFHVKN